MEQESQSSPADETTKRRLETWLSNLSAPAVLGYGLPLTWIAVLLVLGGHLSPVLRFIGATAGLLFSIKVGSWLLLRASAQEYSLSPVQTLTFWTVWPGVRPDLFAGSSEHGKPDEGTFLVGYTYLFVGAILVFVSLLVPPIIGVVHSTWLLLFGLLAFVHMGIGRLLPFGLRWVGYPVPPLFNDPLKSTSVGDFWSDRWNRPFVNMNRLFLTGPLSSRIGIAGAAALAFLVSGFLHELAISYPAGAGWGLPFLYFLVQGLLYTAEKTVFPELDGRPVLGRVWTYLAVLIPLPLLFHAPFRTTFLVPVIEWGRLLLLSFPLDTYVALGLWIGAAGHFLVLGASFQVPKQLDWHTDLDSLDSLNRKLMWTYGGFIVLMIVAFGVLTVLFHDQFVAGTPVALGLCATIAIFWSARILVDTFYFSHDDWPDGIEFVVGHALLTSLFLLLVLIYAGTVAVHVL